MWLHACAGGDEGLDPELVSCLQLSAFDRGSSPPVLIYLFPISPAIQAVSSTRERAANLRLAAGPGSNISLLEIPVKREDRPVSRPLDMFAILRLLPLLSLAAAFECAFTANGVSYDLKPLGGVRSASSRTDTPPTQSEARLRMDLCGDGVGREDGLADEDQVCP